MSDKEARRKNVFISHHHKDDASVDKMQRLLKGKSYNIRNSSIRAKPANRERIKKGLVKDSTIRRLLRMKINWAGTTVVLIGKDTHKRDWVNWEIEEANRQGKRIVGVWESGSDRSDMPPSLEKYADAIVGWQGDQIIDAIDGKINNWQQPDGSPWPKRGISRFNC